MMTHLHDDHDHDHDHDHDRRPRVKPLQLLTFALGVAAVVKELRLPADQRTWHGTVAGFVPYDLRVPTPGRLRAKLWNPEGALLGPHVFGVGWSLNVGRLVALVRERSHAAG